MVPFLAQDSDFSEEDSDLSSNDESVESRTTLATSESEAIHLSSFSEVESPDESEPTHEPSGLTQPTLETSQSSSSLSISEPLQTTSHLLSSVSGLEHTEEPITPSQCTSNVLTYKLVGDNLDDTITPRFVRADTYRKKSVHYFNSYAIKDRIDFSHLSPVHPPPTCHPSPLYTAESLLPSISDDQVIRKNMSTLVGRIIVSHMDFFKTSFSDVVDWHITHKYYAEMSQRSEIVSYIYGSLSPLFQCP